MKNDTSKHQPLMYIFDRDIHLQPAGKFVFEGDISSNWSINGSPNGGYLAALLAGAMQQISDKKKPVIVTVNFLSKCKTQKASVTAEKVSAGKQDNRLQASLIQNGVEATRCWGTFMDENDCASAPERYEKKPPRISSRSECLPIPLFSQYSLYTQMDTLLDPSCAGWIKEKGELSAISENKGWIKFKDDRPVDALSLLLMADSFPPPALASHGPVAWVPTIEYSVNLRALPETPWIKGVFRSSYMTCGIVEEDGELWDENGKLLAISRQIAQFRKA